MKCVPVSRGFVALVDDEDYETISKYHWCCSGGYPTRGYHENGKLRIEKMHQAVLGLPPEGYEIDHINGDRFDNRKSNLRLLTHQQNCFNRSKLTKPCSSQYKGVCWRQDCQKWQSRICANGKRHSLGFFKSEVEAAIAYNVAAQRTFGTFARLNIIKEETELCQQK